MPPASFSYTNPQHGGHSGAVAGASGGAVLVQQDPEFGIDDGTSDVVVEKKSCFRRKCVPAVLAAARYRLVKVPVGSAQPCSALLPLTLHAVVCLVTPTACGAL